MFSSFDVFFGNNGEYFATVRYPWYRRVEKLGIKEIMDDALEDIQSKLSASNIAQELFSSFAAR